MSERSTWRSLLARSSINETEPSLAALIDSAINTYAVEAWRAGDTLAEHIAAILEAEPFAEAIGVGSFVQIIDTPWSSFAWRVDAFDGPNVVLRDTAFGAYAVRTRDEVRLEKRSPSGFDTTWADNNPLEGQ